MNIYIDGYTLTSALGAGISAHRQQFKAHSSGLTDAPWPDVHFPTWLGRCQLNNIAIDPQWMCRNNQLAATGLVQDEFQNRVQAVVDDLGSQRVGVVIGTSTSSIGRTEEGYANLTPDDRLPPAYIQPLTHNPHSPGGFVADFLGIAGPCATVSAACASSAKVFATAKRWLQQDLVDAVVVGGVDSLCLSVIHGFNSLQLVAEHPCQPFDRQRAGISLGEAAGFALLTKDRAVGAAQLLGVGESCDAYHMSSAHPEGLGAELAMQAAAQDAQVSLGQLDYLNLHGTGTKANDATEGLVCERLLSPDTLASATKGWTGHTLGAAGIVEAFICLEALAMQWVPGTLQTDHPEADFNLILNSQAADVSLCMTNSFGFGGTNCAVIFGQSA